MKHSSLAVRHEPDHLQIQDCPILPTQYFTRSVRSTLLGERRLLLAILEEAVDSYCKSCGRPERRSQNQHREAEDWIFSEDRSWFLSFQNICDLLDIEADSLRERLAAWKTARLRKRVALRAGRVYPLRLAANG